MQNTAIEFDEIISECRDLFSKNARLRSRVAGIAPKFYYRSDLHKSKPYPYPANDDSKMVDEDERGEFIAIINYSIIGLIQLEKGLAESLDDDQEQIIQLYDHYANEAKELMLRKNHDYGEAWRDMRISSITDLIYQKY